MNKRVLITGATGLIGRSIRSELGGSRDLFLTSKSGFQFSDDPHEQLDLTNLEQLRAYLDRIQPEVVFHTAAITSVDQAEMYKPLSHTLNVESTRVIAKWCAENHSRLIHYSTDFVFDGSRIDITEDDAPAPMSWYGKTKLESEGVVRTETDDYVIVRPVLVYGTAPDLPRLNFPLLVVAKLSDGQSMKITADQIRKPTYVVDIAKASVDIAQTDYTGILNLCGPEALSVYDFALKVADVFKLDSTLLEPVTTKSMHQSGMRPLKSGFDLKRTKELIDYTPLNVEEGLISLRNMMSS